MEIFISGFYVVLHVSKSQGAPAPGSVHCYVRAGRSDIICGTSLDSCPALSLYAPGLICFPPPAQLAVWRLAHPAGGDGLWPGVLCEGDAGGQG